MLTPAGTGSITKGDKLHYFLYHDVKIEFMSERVNKRCHTRFE